MHYQIDFKRNPNIVVISTEEKIRSGWSIWPKPEVNPRKQTKLARELFATGGVSGILVSPPHQIIVEKKSTFSWTNIMFSIIRCTEKNLGSKGKPKKVAFQGQVA